MEIFFGSTTGHRHDEDLVVRAGGFDFIDVAGVGQLLAVGRNGIHVLAAEVEGRDVVIARREIARPSSVVRSACAQRGPELLARCLRSVRLYSALTANKWLRLNSV